MTEPLIPHDFLATDARPLSTQLQHIVQTWATSQHQLVTIAAEFADSTEWAITGSPTAAHWLAEAADVEVCTAREWIRIGKKLRTLTQIASAFAAGDISYSKVRTLTRIATADNETDLIRLAYDIPAGQLGRALALWLRDNLTPEQLEHHHNQQRSVKWRTEADGMVTFNLRLPPLIAGILISLLTSVVMRTKPRPKPTEPWPTSAQQHADALTELLTTGIGKITTEIIVHVRGDGCTLDDGTPIASSIAERIAPDSILRAMIHDIDGKPVDASNRRRHPTTRQKRIVKERDRQCIDCGRSDLLHYDHNPEYQQTGHTITSELELRCAPCHHARTVSRLLPLRRDVDR